MTHDTRQAEPPAQGEVGSLADMVPISDDALPAGLPLASWIKIVVIMALVAAMNYRQFPRLYYGWIDDPNWTHGFIIPLFSLWLLYSRRHELLGPRRKSGGWAVFLLAVVPACAVHIATYIVNNPWTSQLTMLVVLLAIVWFLAGSRVAMLMWLPILFLAFAMPIPDSIYGPIALWLQNLAAKASTVILKMLGVILTVQQSHIDVWSRSGIHHELTVTEACSGIRSMMAFLALGVAMAYLADHPLWQRIAVVLFAVPVTVFCNILRVIVTCTMFVLDKPSLGRDFMHEFTGMVMLLPALLMIWLFSKLIDSMFVEEADDQPDEPAAPERTQ